MVNMSGITPLHSAMAQGNTEVAQLLIQKGADTAIESLTGWVKKINSIVWKNVCQFTGKLFLIYFQLIFVI